MQFLHYQVGSKMMRAVKFAMLLLVVLNLAGCESSGWIHNASPITATKPFDLDLILVKATSSIGDLAAEKQFLRSEEHTSELQSP